MTMTAKALLTSRMSLQISLQARLVAEMAFTTSGAVSIISLALALEAGTVIVRGGIDRGRLLNVLQRHTAIRVPDDMAMHDPRARVVGLEANDCPATLGNATSAGDTEQERSVSADGVGEVETSGLSGGEDTFALAEDGEVVAVQMDGMRGLEVVLDNEVDPVAGRTVEDDRVGVDRVGERDGREGCHVLERRVVEVDSDGGAAQGGDAVGGQILTDGSEIPSSDGAVAVEVLLRGVATWEEACVGSEGVLAATVFGQDGNQLADGLVLAVSLESGANGRGQGVRDWSAARALVGEDTVGQRAKTIVQVRNTTTGLGNSSEEVRARSLERNVRDLLSNREKYNLPGSSQQ